MDFNGVSVVDDFWIGCRGICLICRFYHVPYIHNYTCIVYCILTLYVVNKLIHVL